MRHMQPSRLIVWTATAMCFFVARVTTSHAANQPESLYVDPPEVQRWLEEGRPVTFLDVREADEFAAGHLPGARNIPYDQIESILSELPHESPIVTYCMHSTHRAPGAAKRLSALGFPNASVLAGGIVAWQAGGQTIHASELAQTPTILPTTKRCDALGARISAHD